ncbi:hypothetical protein BJ944DRAFT_266834 [Cunninghamella echinulata]|nr:hypothetical protein BJ944DRAFT_266834 [Cunninghamella echinulata]
MVSTPERVFIIGGTGNVGQKTVEELLAKKIPVTLYARNPSKVANLFPKYDGDNELLSVVQGDINDLAPLQAALPGHSRLFLLINDLLNLPTLKESIAKLAYDAGIQQIVDISSLSVSFPWRNNFIGYQHYLAEKKVLDLAEENKRSFVALRPGRFMSNILSFDRPSTEKGVVDTASHDLGQGWISPNDIGAVAAVVLQEDIQKHGNAVYELIGDVVTPKKRAELFTAIHGRTYAYQQITALAKYQFLSSLPQLPLPFNAIYDLCTVVETTAVVTPGISILLGREPETLEQFIIATKSAFV